MTGDILFAIIFGTQMIGLMLMVPIWWGMANFTPKVLLSRYFKEPYFAPGELIVMSRSPGNLMRSSIFLWGIILPSRIKRRGITDIREYAPLWFTVMSFMLAAIVTLVLLSGVALVIFDPLLDAINAVFY